MKKLHLLVLSTLLILAGCATSSSTGKSGPKATSETSSKKKSEVKCLKVGSYDNDDLNTFLKTSYDLCNLTSTTVEQLDEINDFLEDPTAWISNEVNKAASPYKQALQNAADPAAAIQSMKKQFANRVKEEIVKELTASLLDAKDKMAGSKNALSAAKGLGGMDKLKAAKDVTNATKNYKTAISLAEELQKQATRIVDNLTG